MEPVDSHASPRTPRFVPRSQQPRRRWIAVTVLIVTVLAVGAS